MPVLAAGCQAAGHPSQLAAAPIAAGSAAHDCLNTCLFLAASALHVALLPTKCGAAAGHRTHPPLTPARTGGCRVHHCCCLLAVLQVVLRVGNFITGTYLEEDDVVSAEATQLNGRDFYVYEVRPWMTGCS